MRMQPSEVSKVSSADHISRHSLLRHFCSTSATTCDACVEEFIPSKDSNVDVKVKKSELQKAQRAVVNVPGCPHAPQSLAAPA